MSISSFSEQINEILSRLTDLEQQFPKISTVREGHLLSRAIEALSRAVEVLENTKEELFQQNWALTAAQQTIDLERRRYRNLFEYAPDGYIVTDIKGIIQQSNQVASKLFNTSSHHLVGKPLAIFINKTSHHTFYTELNSVPAPNQAKSLELLVRPRERPSFLAQFTVAVVQNEEGNPHELRWLLRDISSIKAMEEEIKTSNNALQQRVEEHSRQLEVEKLMREDAVWAEKRAWAEVSEIAECSELLAELSDVLGHSLNRQELLSNLLHMIVPKLVDLCILFEVTQSGMFQLWAAECAGGLKEALLSNIQTLHVEEALKYLSLHKPDLMVDLVDLSVDHEGEQDELLKVFKDCNVGKLFAMPLIARGQVIGTLVLGIEVSHSTRSLLNISLAEGIAQRIAQAIDNARLYAGEQMARRAAEEANDLKLNFLGMISHELRTPLTTIKGFASTLIADDVTWSRQDQHEFIVAMDEEADRLTDLIEQLLDLSRLQSGTFSTRVVPFSLHDLVVASMPEFMALAVRHKLVVDVNTRLPLLLIDPPRITQVLTNLIDNSAKYSAAGTSITITAYSKGKMVYVCIGDEGSGIPTHYREWVFETFRRIDDGSTGNTSGSGLGLAICRKLIEAHGGHIWIEDQPIGTMICFTLPIALHPEGLK